MIRYDLVCPNGHRFDAWFRNGAAFDEQAAQGLLDCPSCGDTRITKALMTPGVRTARGRAAPETDEADAPKTEGKAAAPLPGPANPAPPALAPARPVPPAVMEMAARAAAMRNVMRKVHAHVTATSEDVGDDFAKEARRIHDGEAEARGIYGRANRREVEDLLDDGIEVMPLPVPPDTDA